MVEGVIDGGDLGTGGVGVDFWLSTGVDGGNPCCDGDIEIGCCCEGEASVASRATTEVGDVSNCITGQLVVADFDGIVGWYTGDPGKDTVGHTVNY